MPEVPPHRGSHSTIATDAYHETPNIDPPGSHIPHKRVIRPSEKTRHLERLTKKIAMAAHHQIQLVAKEQVLLARLDSLGV